MLRRIVAFLLSLVIALAGVIGILLLLESRDSGSLDRPPITRTVTTP